MISNTAKVVKYKSGFYINRYKNFVYRRHWVGKDHDYITSLAAQKTTDLGAAGFISKP